MSLLSRITPLVLTWNEEPNIGRVLERLRWAKELVVIDSGSSDRTLDLVHDHPNARVVIRQFTTYADQWNHALHETKVATDWVLTLDADHVLSDGFVSELDSLQPRSDTVGYEAGFVYWSLGRPLRGSLYPPRTVLFRASSGLFIEDGHTQRLILDGSTQRLRSPIHHDDRKDLARWLRSQAEYARLESKAPSARGGRWKRRLRRVGLTPFLAAAYALFVKGTLFDGHAGLYYAAQRAIAEGIICLAAWERR